MLLSSLSVYYVDIKIVVFYPFLLWVENLVNSIRISLMETTSDIIKWKTFFGRFFKSKMLICCLGFWVPYFKISFGLSIHNIKIAPLATTAAFFGNGEKVDKRVTKIYFHCCKLTKRWFFWLKGIHCPSSQHREQSRRRGSTK